MKVMDKIIFLPPQKEEEIPKEMPKNKGFGFVRMLFLSPNNLTQQQWNYCNYEESIYSVK